MLKRTNIDTSTSPSTTTWTVYIGGIFEKNFSSVTGVTGTTKYYVAAGRAIAVRQTPTSGPMTLSYVLADHLGSTVGAIDSVTGAVSRQAYWPYGATRSTSGALTTDKLYTGQQQEPTGALQDATAALGLYYYKARFYSTTTGRFVSADTLTSDGMNRYTYVRNNPLRHSDPTGHCIPDYDGPRGCGLDPVTPEVQGPPAPEVQGPPIPEVFPYANCDAGCQDDARRGGVDSPGLPSPGQVVVAIGSVAEAVGASRLATKVEYGPIVLPGLLTLELVGAALLSPCDSKGCTTLPAKVDNNGNPLPKGAVKIRGDAGYKTRQRTIYVPYRVGTESPRTGEPGGHKGEDGEERRPNGQYRNVTCCDAKGNLVPVPGVAGEWHMPKSQ